MFRRRLAIYEQYGLLIEPIMGAQFPLRLPMVAMLGVALLVCLIALTACATSSIVERWNEQWNNRIQDYVSDVAAAVSRMEENTRLLQVTLTQGANRYNFADVYLETVDTNYEVGRAQGRLTMLRIFLEFLASDPTNGMTQSWLWDTGRQFQQSHDEMRRSEEEILRAAAANRNWAGDYLQLTYTKGLLAGGIDELLRVSNEFSAFSQDVAEARQQDMQTRIALGAALQRMGQSMQRAYQEQALALALSRPITCSQFGRFVTCN